jgi:hypothetical protein
MAEEKITSLEHGRRLTAEQSWKSLFLQDIPKDESSLSPRAIAKSIRDSLANFHLVLTLPSIHEKWLTLKSKEISAKNTCSISFTPWTTPFFILEHNLFRDITTHTEAIQIRDLNEVKKLELKLREQRVLRRDGSLAGEALFIYENRFAVDKLAEAIGFGVVNSNTNKPEGIIFCPTDMFQYQKCTTFTDPRFRKKLNP